MAGAFLDVLDLIEDLGRNHGWEGATKEEIARAAMATSTQTSRGSAHRKIRVAAGDRVEIVKSTTAAIAPPAADFEPMPVDQKETADYRRIARAIEFIRDRTTLQPSLDEVAQAVDLSPFHLQRLFSRWAGISPKRFLQAVTVEQAKDRLRGHADVLTATLEVGMSSPSRLHDLFVALEAMTPGEYKERGGGLTIRYGFSSSPLGDCFAAVTDRGICALEFADSESDRAEIETRFRREWARAQLIEDPKSVAATLEKIFSPQPTGAGPLSALVRGTNFQVQVWRALLELPRSKTTTYLALAQAIGRPKAYRAVANAVAANPVGFLIPCHRVLRQDGRVGGYRWGEPRKAAALLWEAS
jgi:AraC family transcriptional regulator of adaptative response/methylated-DNA-[protein]-cysteine methyltransferase